MNSTMSTGNRTPIDGFSSIFLLVLLWTTPGIAQPDRADAGITADLIVTAADIYTMDASNPRAEAFAVRDGRFLAVGSAATIKALAGPETVIVDAQGASVTPGFIDGHSHMSGNAPRVAGVDLSYVADKSEWLRLIKEADARLQHGEWMTGGYWDHTLADGVYPDRWLLDRVLPDRPAFLTHIDGHYGWANSKALKLAGIKAESPVPPGGEIVLDPATGEPNGILLEGAMDLVSRVIPAQEPLRRRARLQLMQDYANSLGLTGLHQMGDLEDYLQLIASTSPSLRVWYGAMGPSDNTQPAEAIGKILARREEIAREVAATGKPARLGPLLAMGYVKLMNDGVLSARTAVLLDDYHDQQGWRGRYMVEPGDLQELIGQINAAGLPVAIHSIGDAAVRASLDAFAAAGAHRPTLPNRIEHIEVVEPSDVARFRALGVAASMQPNHCTNAIGYVPARLGPERETHAYVWRAMLDAGVPLIFGADYPTSPLSPLTQIADAMFRTSPFGFQDGKPWYPDQALGFEEALKAYTQAPASMTAWAAEIGSITVGKWADFVLLDGRVPEPMTEEFRKLSVKATYFAGRAVYSSQAETSTPIP